MADSAANANHQPERPGASRHDAPEMLLERYLDGDDDAFGLLVARYEEKLYAFIARMTGDGHLAEDVFQQVFIKVAKNAAAFDGRASFSTWLYRIARNAALDELRRRARRPGDFGGIEAENANLPDPGGRSPLDKMAVDELAEQVRGILATLPEAQREAFLLKEEGDLDFGQIGVILGCGKETAKSRFRLAVGKIRAGLGLARGRDDNGR